MTPNLPPPPVPQRLREMLKDYPELIQEIQEVLIKVVTDGPLSIPPFEWATWRLDDTLSAFRADACDELEAAEATADLEAIEHAKAKRMLMGRIRSDRPWNDDGDESLWAYFQTHKEAFQ